MNKHKVKECTYLLTNAVANLANVLQMKREHDACVNILHNIHCGCFSLSYILVYLLASVLSAYFLAFLLTVHIRPAFYGNVNTNSSQSVQTSYDHFKCLANNQKGLGSVCFPSEFYMLIFVTPQN